MKNVMLKIVGSQITHQLGEDSEQDVMEFVTEGQMTQKGDSLYILYKETELSGMAGCTTSLKISGDKIKMMRYGEQMPLDTVIEFEKGKRFEGYYGTPFGTIEMEVLTNSIENGLSPGEDGKGSVAIDYNVSLRGLTEGRNRLSVEIL